MLYQQEIYVGHCFLLDKVMPLLRAKGLEKVYVLIDRQVENLYQSYLSSLRETLPSDHFFEIDGGEAAKELSSVQEYAGRLLRAGANRQSTFVAIGGGVITDMVAFLASIYMRGVSCILLPTTLLAMVDASVGGKSAVNLCGVKNVLGTFAPAEAVLCDVSFLSTLSESDLMSGYGELLKHALLQGEEAWRQLLCFNPWEQSTPQWISVVERAVAYKQSVVTQDFYDRGVRRYLNLGHTFGHALETLSHCRRDGLEALSHGAAVAAGLVCELYASVLWSGFPRQVLFQYICHYKELYPRFLITCKEYKEIVEYMLYDKKNGAPQKKDACVNCVALSQLGKPSMVLLSEEEIKDCLDFYREALG